ncbi:diacylglyceryl transferase [Alloyangia pacifica]|uniref:Diacylglyceryl transferase n=1 Tax=Alloyangia pacifica TaxID=311180 RepID=A0A2U8HF33_9RHOB|nr:MULTISPECIES: YbjN domain-containing protein [Roseobacteraceae]AWI84431.1 diacylglyceryl transferase [Alloyangia pacifica]NDV54094.1 diacylglyceryl transferase [Salipiger sp. PrR003]NDW32267.1 diacylglyceryl transferase [Salipiger sp. PrR007]
MALSEDFLSEELHPIDIVETLAETNDWDFDRVGEDQIAMAVEGQWRTYSITLAWSPYDETLRMICSFEMEPPKDSLPELYAGLNAVNDQCWAGAFCYWAESKLMVYRYGLVLAGGQVASAEQIDTMIGAAVMTSERYYPCFQLINWAGKSAKEALQIAMAEAYGRA